MPSFDGDDLRAVERAIEDHIADSGHLPSTPEIISAVEIGGRNVRQLLDELVRQDRVTVAYEAPKNPTIYVPTYMYREMLRHEQRPEWMKSYAFEEAASIKKAIEAREDQLSLFHRIERLLYATGKSLEESIEQALRLLQFRNLACPYEDPDSWDFQFVSEGVTYIADVKGKSRWANKSDVAQLQQWLLSFIDNNPDADPQHVRGLLIINHFRDVPPKERGPDNPDRPPLSTSAERYLQLGRLCYLTTVDVFDVARRVLSEEIAESEARKQFINRVRTETRPN